ncbi:hypothetical protein AVEN_158191-1 [Araneus ventricosus]|uniref:Uncharacterized protein n=1 Tax=Araneus ventricosus TaxID=182803 RepID=A0A4Y2G9D1_ARAVE|nr:hypothetical protein AVEN_158191-1 [Araneus ventricosus]
MLIISLFRDYCGPSCHSNYTEMNLTRKMKGNRLKFTYLLQLTIIYETNKIHEHKKSLFSGNYLKNSVTGEIIAKILKTRLNEEGSTFRKVSTESEVSAKSRNNPLSEKLIRLRQNFTMH